MYNDSQHGLTIDLSGPDGNAFALLGYARQYAKELSLDSEKIQFDMMSGDYANVVAVFERNFPMITLLHKPGESGDGYEPATNLCPNCEGDGCLCCEGTGEVFE